MHYNMITIGDALIDTFLAIEKASKYSTVDHETSKICFDSGSKILVDTAQFELGGNAANVAVGISRLGFSTALGAEIGTDEFSEKIIHALEKDNVQKNLLVQTPNAPSTFSMCLNIEGERTLFVRHVLRDHAIPLDSVSSDWVYLTSLGKEWKDMYTRTAQFVQKTKAKLACNPGSTQIAEGRESFKEILAITDVLFVNKEEAEEIVYGALQHTQNTATEPQTLLQELQKLGPKMVVLTDGKNGAYALTETGEFFSMGIYPDLHIVEKTGAGDAFASGFLGALLSGKGVKEALQWATAESAAVMEYVGAQKGLLTKQQIEERIKQLL